MLAIFKFFNYETGYIKICIEFHNFKKSISKNKTNDVLNRDGRALAVVEVDFANLLKIR